jgi:hypothetical protein
LNPIQAHYQAVLRPDFKEAQDVAWISHFQARKRLGGCQAHKASNPRTAGCFQTRTR